MNKLMLYLSEKQREWIRREAFINRDSMNQVVRDLIDARIAVKPYADLIKPSKDEKKAAKEIVKKKFVGLCKHGSQKGLCKNGC